MIRSHVVHRVVYASLVATFFAALVPRRATAVQPAALVPLADTVFLVRGRPVRWLHTDGGGQAAERPAADKEAVDIRFF